MPQKRTVKQIGFDLASIAIAVFSAPAKLASSASQPAYAGGYGEDADARMLLPKGYTVTSTTPEQTAA